MYKPNFILVGGVAGVVKKADRDYLAECQINGNYSGALEESLMAQFKSMMNEDDNGQYLKTNHNTSQYTSQRNC